MQAPLERLGKLSVAPSRQDGAFENWLEARDAIEFLELNAREEDFVLYASLDFVYFETVVVAIERLNPPDMNDLLKWDQIRDRWGYNYNYSEPPVFISPPMEHSDSVTLRGAEPLVYQRSFEGFDSDKSYIEFLQKFVHIFDLHFVPHKNAYCTLDEHGDLFEVIKIIKIPNTHDGYGGVVVTVKRKTLDEFLLISNAALVRVFDFTRLDKSNFHGWGDTREQAEEFGKSISYRLTIQHGVGSYLRGVQVVWPSESMDEYHYRLTHRDEKREYASFIGHDAKNSVVREISTKPGATANYFTKSNLPFEVTPAFFRPEVLQKYKADQQKYSIDERSISCRGSWHLKTYDINEAGQVHTYIVYLRRLPYAEQLYWKSFNEAPKGPISKRALATDIKGEFYLEYNPLQNLKKRARELKVSWWQLRDDKVLSTLHYPATSSKEEWGNEIMTLDKLLIEGFEERWLRKKADSLGVTSQAADRSLALVEHCLQGLGFEGEHAIETVAPLRTLHHLRTKLKGHLGGRESEEIRVKALQDHGSYKGHFENLCASCDNAMERIVEAFKSFD